MSALTEAEIETLSPTQALSRLGITKSRDAHSHCDARHTLRGVLPSWAKGENWFAADLPARNTVAALEQLLSSI